MAPHTEKTELISKPIPRRSTSKSPSKAAIESKEMPEPIEVKESSRKLSVQVPAAATPSRKVSAPELGNSSKSRSTRRNLYTEKCISQDEKQNLKSKPSWKKLAADAVSNSKAIVKKEASLQSEDKKPTTSKCEGAQLVTKPAPTIESSKSPLKVPPLESKNLSQPSKPPPEIEESKSAKLLTPENKEQSQLVQVTPPTRKKSAPELCSSTSSRNGGRKLYTERCISQDEKEHLKSKPAVKKEKKESVSSSKDNVNKDDELSKDSTPASGKAKLVEKVQLRPKSAQRKISAPAKIVPLTNQHPNLITNGTDTPSYGSALDSGRKPDFPAVEVDSGMSSIREEDGKPSFAKAAKVVHAKVQVVTCFRSSGSMPIPRPIRTSFCGLPPPPKPRKLDPPKTNEAKEINLNIELETTIDLPDFEPFEDTAKETNVPRWNRCIRVRLKIINNPGGFNIKEDILLRNRSDNSCIKHSKCHCNLLSKGVDNFHTITPK